MSRFIQRDAGQAAGCERAGIDIDSIGQHLRLINRRVPVHDDLSEIHFAVEKLITNPQQIFVALLVLGLLGFTTDRLFRWGIYAFAGRYSPVT